jgi:AcrR family transcriptional regulator
MSPRPSRSAERKPQILAAAARVIAERGLDDTRLTDVAREARVSVGTVQHYFGTRDQLLLEAFAYEAETALERWFAAVDGKADGWAQVMALIDAVLAQQTFRARWTRWLEFWARGTRDPRLRVEMDAVFEQWRGTVARAIEAGVRTGMFSPKLPVDDVVDRTVAAFDGLALQVLLEAPGMSLERMRYLLVEGLAADLGVTSSSRGTADKVSIPRSVMSNVSM